MIGIDTNVIVHYLAARTAEHDRVRRWFAGASEQLATTATNLAEALRLLTHPRVFPKPLRLERACTLLADFVSALQVIVVEDSEDWLHDLRALAPTIPSLRGNEVFDARIALCLRHNGIKEICTLDADFAKYDFLEVVRP